jgi:site-specific DNA-adenine methylase
MTTKPKKLRPAFKCHGGKFYLSDWIIDHLPDNYQTYDYVEPFVGGGSVFLNKIAADEGKIEVINDLDLGVVRIYQALRDEPEAFIKALKRITYSENVFERELKKYGKFESQRWLEHAVNEFVVRRMSRGGSEDRICVVRPQARRSAGRCERLEDDHQ